MVMPAVLFVQAIGVDAGESLHEGGLAVIDVPGRAMMTDFMRKQYRGRLLVLVGGGWLAGLRRREHARVEREGHHFGSPCFRCIFAMRHWRPKNQRTIACSL